MNEHIHKVGIKGRSGQYRFYCECRKWFLYDGAMIYIERSMGEVDGREYWIKLRMMLERMRTRKKMTGEFIEGMVYPE